MMQKSPVSRNCFLCVSLRSPRLSVVFFFLLPLIALPPSSPAAAQAAGNWLTHKDRQAIERMQKEISPAEMQKILVPFNSLDRVSSSEGEARGAELLAQALAGYGVPLDPAGDECGFLRTQMIRERNRVADTLDFALDAIAELFSRPPVLMHAPSHPSAKEKKP